MHDGQQRSYMLYVPEIYAADTPVPLVFNFHGYTSNASEQMFYGDFRSIADTANFIIVHPQGTLLNGVTHWNVGGWTLGSTVDDVGFTETLIDEISATYNIDLSRVYATGMSNGGFMSYKLACQLGTKIAAIASVTGSMTPQIFNNCTPSHPTPVMEIHGTADRTIPYNGASFTKPITTTLDFWVDYNNTNSVASTTMLEDINVSDGSTVEHIIYAGGDNDTKVEHFKVVGGGHTWPGTNFGAANQDFNASLEIWNFFSNYNLDFLMSSTTSISSIEKSQIIAISPNPTWSFLRLEMKVTKPITYEIVSILGQPVLNGQLLTNNPIIDLATLPADIYFLKIEGNSYKIIKM